ncbi:hypothetical protein P9112_003664 [Eukaryota sp. TZLM1-RC]
MNYTFHNLCGAFHSGGDIRFHPMSKSIFSIVGNRVILYDLEKSSLRTLPAESRSEIDRLVISPNGNLVLTIDNTGQGLVQSLSGGLLHRFNFKKPVTAASLSPDFSLLAVSFGRLVRVYRTPPPCPSNPPFVLVTTITGHTSNITSLSFSPCSTMLLTGSEDCTARLSYLDETPSVVFSTHRASVIGTWFLNHESIDQIITFAADGCCVVWETDPDDSDRFKMKTRHLFHSNSNIQTPHFSASTCAMSATGLLSFGLDIGVFCLADVTTGDVIQTLSIGNFPLTACDINQSSELIGFASAQSGLLTVWSWESETFLFKFTGSLSPLPTCTAYSNDGRLVATGNNDGMVRVFNPETGTCWGSFRAHNCPVNSIDFSGQGSNLVVVTSSSDGTIKAHDVIKRKCFRVMTCNSTNLGKLTVDSMGDLIAVVSNDEFLINVFQLRTGKVLESLAGHESSITGLDFSSSKGLLASCSLDKTVRVFDLYARDRSSEVLNHQSECVTVAFSPNSKYLAVSCLDGTVVVWNVEQGAEAFSISNKYDAPSGRLDNSALTAEKQAHDKYFGSIQFSADGKFLFGAGNSRFVCAYSLPENGNQLPLLIGRFPVTNNRSLSGVKLKLNSKDIGERKEASNAISISEIALSPCNSYLCAATSIGLILLKNEDFIGGNIDDVNGTPYDVYKSFEVNNFGRSLMIALSLGNSELVTSLVKAIPVSEVDLCLSSVSEGKLPFLLTALSNVVNDSTVGLVWITKIFKVFGKILRKPLYDPYLRQLLKNLDDFTSLKKIIDSNSYLLEYLNSFN